MGRLTDYQVHTWLDQINFLWLSLHYDNPDVAGAYASEVFGGSYARIKCDMGQPSSRGLLNTASVLFRALPTVGVTHVGGWDAQNNGNLLVFAELPEMRRISAGQNYSVPAGTIAISFG